MGRRSIWSKPDIIELSKNYVPATDEVWRLQRGTDPECLHFQKFADSGHYRKHGSTRQGTYVCTPSGVLLGSLNTHNTQAVVELLQEGLEKYAALPKSERLLSDTSEILPKHRWEHSYPTGGLDLTMYVRDLPKSGDPKHQADQNWNPDRAWFSQGESLKLLPVDRANIRVGQRWELPETFVTRLARFNIVDTVKGQTSFFGTQEVDGSEISATVESVNATEIKLKLHGKTVASSKLSRGREFPHGISTSILGTATFDRRAEEFTQFEIVAVGSRYGRTVFNGRKRQLDASPIGFVFQLTRPETPLIAPAAIEWYQADWIQRPEN